MNEIKKKKISKDQVLLFKIRVLEFCLAGLTRELEGLLAGPHAPYYQMHFIINPQASLRMNSEVGKKSFHEMTARWRYRV